MKNSSITRMCKTLLSETSKTNNLPPKARGIIYGSCIAPKANTTIPWVSVEIECFFKNQKITWELLARAFNDVGLASHVRIKEDASINDWTDVTCTAEVVVSAPESKVLSILEKVCCVLNSFNAKTNDSCGLHIHIDHRPVLKRSPLMSYNNLYYAEDILYKVSKPYRRDCEFCYPVSEAGDIFASLTTDSYSDDRYRSINVQAMECHKTLEIRTFHGTTNFGEISHFVNLVLGLINSKMIFNSRIGPKNIDLCKTIPLATRKFVKSKFGSIKNPSVKNRKRAA